MHLHARIHLRIFMDNIWWRHGQHISYNFYFCSPSCSPSLYEEEDTCVIWGRGYIYIHIIFISVHHHYKSYPYIPWIIFGDYLDSIWGLFVTRIIVIYGVKMGLSVPKPSTLTPKPYYTLVTRIIVIYGVKMGLSVPKPSTLTPKPYYTLVTRIIVIYGVKIDPIFGHHSSTHTTARAERVHCCMSHTRWFSITESERECTLVYVAHTLLLEQREYIVVCRTHATLTMLQVAHTLP